jgi:hypothetical protein
MEMKMYQKMVHYKVGKQQYICNNKQCHKSSFLLDYTYNACKSEVKSKIIPMTF